MADADSPKKSKSTIWIVVFIILAVALAGTAFYFFYWRRRHHTDPSGSPITVGTAVVTTFTGSHTEMCATAAAAHSYKAYGVVTAVSGSNATVLWLAMYDTAGGQTCQWVRGAQKGVHGTSSTSATWIGDWMGIGSTPPVVNTELQVVVPLTSLTAVTVNNF